MCMGGGTDPTVAAAQAEAKRNATISGNVGAINRAFGGREAQYKDFEDALRSLYQGELGRQQSTATRQSKFSLARSGLTGGSAAIDSGRQLAREASEGTLSAERNTRKGVSDLRGADEESRLRLISLAQSGSDIGNAASQTANALRANIGQASATNIASGLGDVFGNTAAAYRAQQDAAERRRGLQTATSYAKPFSRG